MLSHWVELSFDASNWNKKDNALEWENVSLGHIGMIIIYLIATTQRQPRLFYAKKYKPHGVMSFVIGVMAVFCHCFYDRWDPSKKKTHYLLVKS
jgi:hypothetical protein